MGETLATVALCVDYISARSRGKLSQHITTDADITYELRDFASATLCENICTVLTLYASSKDCQKLKHF